MTIEYPSTLTNGRTRQEILALLHNRLNQERFEHCLRVEETARELAERFGEDVDRAGLAGLLHDYAKQVPIADYIDVIKRNGFDLKLLKYNRGVWHGMVGTWFIKQEVGVTDHLVIQAIERHTTGDPQMTTLDQIIFVADFIEPARDLPIEAKAREAAKTSMREATLIELENTLTYLIGKRQVVYPKTLLTYNAFIQPKE
ncbi:bis(5'-nucleosyl)-tetraphosphatase (symmetrical) YqeK [Lacticaseibacillus jixiensis]|uniref:bis(5'-nucleosyl)-tetraphosphatase (symmetrical) YqeK n=1 Tax=Lacticaseibacillus jixiensis TaxID=3231926 RepID=UPI0036F2A74F